MELFELYFFNNIIVLNLFLISLDIYIIFILFSIINHLFWFFLIKPNLYTLYINAFQKVIYKFFKVYLNLVFILIFKYKLVNFTHIKLFGNFVVFKLKPKICVFYWQGITFNCQEWILFLKIFIKIFQNISVNYKNIVF